MFKNFISIKSIFLFILLPLLFVSCSSFGPFKGLTNKTKIKNTAEQPQLTTLESELLKSKHDQEKLKLEIQKKNTIIKELQDTIAKLEEHNKTTKESELSAITPISAATAPAAQKLSSPSALYSRARKLLLKKQYENAAALFNEVRKKYTLKAALQIIAFIGLVNAAML